MRTSSLLLLLVFPTTVLLISGCSKKNVDAERLQKVVVYTYDSFTSDWGAGGIIESLFEAKTGYNLEYVSFDDDIQLVSRPILEREAPQADVVLGIDDSLAVHGIEAKIFAPYKPKNAEQFIDTSLLINGGNRWQLVPFDWSHFSMVYDSDASVPAPECLADLTRDVYRQKIIMLDPRTSTPGLGFVAWTVAAFGDAYLDYWRALKPNILTVASSWSSGYKLFTKGEAPLVVSYTTSPAYHVEYEKTDRYKSLLFSDGHVLQTEYAGIVRNCLNEKGAKAFMDFLISHEAQEILPLTQWMYPVNHTVRLPKSYQNAAPVPEKTISADPAAVEAAVEQVVALLAE
ncbi:MAG: thiamine ABC transporter substrate-binding protein [Treponema sp.]|nr:thiamine ABC transporter substrate-binding protein [Treponema sp.]